MGRGAGRLFTLLALVLIAAVAAVAWFDHAASRPGPATKAVTVVIPHGAGLATIAQELESNGVIDSGLVFALRARWLGDARHLKAGEYAFAPGTSIDRALDLMVSGHTVVHRVTVPEGWTSPQVVALLDADQALSGKIAKLPAEGSLLPETYDFSRGDSRAGIIERMTKAMDRTLAKLWATRAPGLPFKTPEQAVVLASIVEKETGVPDERAHIAGIFINRLRRHMPLQSDPTVIFALTHGKAPLGHELTEADLKVDDPYNTYLHRGLPPGPIANPGRDAIAAVLQPMTTDDLYFVADGSGGHVFSRTLAEHNRNVARYRAFERKQQQQQQTQ